MSPIAQSNGHDAPRLIAELIPCVATKFDDLFVRIEDAVGEPVVADELPDVFGWVEFRRLGRQVQKKWAPYATQRPSRIRGIRRSRLKTSIANGPRILTGLKNNAYEVMLEHWREVLPVDVMLDVRYEELVADLEGQARRPPLPPEIFAATPHAHAPERPGCGQTE